MTDGIIHKRGRGKLRHLFGILEENKKLLRSRVFEMTDFGKYSSNSLYLLQQACVHDC
jgi:hypothetical protein